jgi:hypothetical protein
MPNIIQQYSGQFLNELTRLPESTVQELSYFLKLALPLTLKKRASPRPDRGLSLKTCSNSVRSIDPDFSQFSAAITDCLEQTHLQYKQELDSLLTLKFQSFNKAQIIAA